MKKFLVTLVKATFWSWLALFMLINPIVFLVLGGLSGLGLDWISGSFAAYVMWGLTAILFAAFWVAAYADKLASWGAVLRMKWDLRGVGKD